MTEPGPMLLVGCGKMGGAMLAGWLAGGSAEGGVVAVEPNAEAMAAFATDRRVRRVASLDEVPADVAPETVVLAVKPQMMETALQGLGERLPRDAMVLSVAAGKTIAYFEALFGDRPIVRAMPNTPAAIGRGITAWIANAHTTEAQATRADGLLKAVGETVRLETEDQINVVTALSGGGPAYVFHLVEAMARAGEAQGLGADIAMALARKTVAGAGALLDASQDSAEQLRVNVTSPKGTTERALAVLMADDGFPDLLARAVAAATDRSRELAG